MENLNEIFLRNLNKLMERDKINDNTLEEALKLSNGTVSKWRNRGSLPRLKVLINIASYFNVTVDYLIRDNLDDDNFDNYKKEKNTIQMNALIDALITDPLNCYVPWQLVEEYPFTEKEVDFIYNLDFKYTESYVFSDEENNIDFYLLCKYEKDPFDINREIYYFVYNKAFSPCLRKKDDYIVTEMFNYFHNKHIASAGKQFYHKNMR